MNQVVFDEASHTYTLKGVAVPSVTQILGHFFGGFEFVRQDTLRAASERGRAAHLATELDDEGCLDESTVDASIRGYLDAYRKFKAEKVFKPSLIEQLVYHPYMNYAGTLDRFGTLDGEPVLIDLKTGGQMPWHGAQTAGYATALFRVVNRRFGLELRANGTYRLHQHKDPADFDAFKYAVNLYHYKLKIGAIK